MKTLSKLLLSVFLSITLSSCAVTPEQMSQLDFGKEPTKETYTKIVKEYLEGVIKDPESLKIYEITPPRPIAYKVTFTDIEYGWFVCAIINAKNSYGGYVGKRSVGFIIFNDQLLRANNFEVLVRCEEETSIKNILVN